MSGSLRLSNKSKLIARELSEGLGKLPPQVPELEDSVIGALLTESKALYEVSQFLNPNHFYSETHKLIYESILALEKEGKPHDMRMVVNHLRETGGIELIGGQMTIVELSNKVSSAANIAHHARVVIEMSLKRDLIAVASRIHQDAYEDTTDVFDLLSSLENHLQYITKVSIKESPEKKTKALWENILVTDEPPPIEVLIRIKDEIAATAGNYGTIVGKKKSRKTLFVVWYVSEFIRQNKDNRAMIFDTEQGKHHVFRVREKIKKLSGAEIPVFYLRGRSPFERRQIIENTIEYWPNRPRLVVIDGIRDLMVDINSVEETSEIIVWLEALTLKYNLHIDLVLHLNKVDSNTRGHIGSELENKSEIVIEIEKDEKTGISEIKCKESREKGFEPFSFTHDNDAMPALTDTVVKSEEEMSDRARKESLIQSFEGEATLTSKDLLKQIGGFFNVGRDKSYKLVKEFTKKGWVVRNGGLNDPKAVYKLMVSADNPNPEPAPVIPVDQQPELFERKIVPMSEEKPMPNVSDDDLPF